MRRIKSRAVTRLESRATTIRKMAVRMCGSNALQIRQSTAASLAGLLVEISARRFGGSTPVRRSVLLMTADRHATPEHPACPQVKWAPCNSR